MIAVGDALDMLCMAHNINPFYHKCTYGVKYFCTGVIAGENVIFDLSRIAWLTSEFRRLKNDV